MNDLVTFVTQFFAAIPGTFDTKLDEEYSFITSPQLLRDMMLPVFMNPDMKTGFGAPWEMNIISGHLLRGKGGNTNGFAADIQMIPEMRLAIVALTNYEIDGRKHIGHNFLFFNKCFIKFLSSSSKIL